MLLLVLLLCAITVNANSEYSYLYEDYYNDDESIGTVPKLPGTPWPLPQVYKPSNRPTFLDSKDFRFKYNQSCDIIISAIQRYYKIIFTQPEDYEIIEGKKLFKVKRFKNSDVSVESINSTIDGPLSIISINISGSCERYPSYDTDESCKLIIIILFLYFNFF